MNKELILKDLSARLRYGVICKWTFYDGSERNEELKELSDLNIFFITKAKDVEVIPYLRSMSSMTVDESQELFELLYNVEKLSFSEVLFNNKGIISNVYEWLLKNHFDFRGLIEKGAAFEAPEGMYKGE